VKQPVGGLQNAVQDWKNPTAIDRYMVKHVTIKGNACNKVTNERERRGTRAG